MIQRQMIESIERQKQDMINATYINPNWDEEANREKRSEYISEIEFHFNRAMEMVYEPDKYKVQEAEIDWSHPFYAAIKRGLARTRQQLGIDDKTVGEVTGLDTDQLEARRRSKASIDQM
jgi:hypothetical protein